MIIIIFRSGRLFTFGSNEWGQLGLGHNSNVIKPSCVKVIRKVQIGDSKCMQNQLFIDQPVHKL